jgi:thioredoxin-dependent peroxiredoxin
MEERDNSVTLKGNPITLIGSELKKGQVAPDFKLIDSSMKEVSLSRTKTKAKLISVVFSLETPICDTQTHNFNEEAGRYPDLIAYSVSMDLPFTLERIRKEHGIKSLKLLSDHREGSFGQSYGLLIKGMRLLARAVFILDKDNVVKYVEYVPDIASQPDYAKAFAALKKIAA